MRTLVPLALGLLAFGCGERLAPGLASLELSPDSALHFPVIGDTLQLTLRATDQDGRSVLPVDVELVSRLPSVVQVDARGRLWSVADGETYVVARSGSLRDSVKVSVLQARDSLVLSLAGTGSIVMLPGDARFPLSCRAFDVAGSLLDLATTVVSATGRVVGTSCQSLVAQSSGHDTLQVVAGGYLTMLPIVVAIHPRVLTDPAVSLPVDSLPGQSSPWAPTLIKNSRGELDLYFAAYRKAPYPLKGKLGDLHRLTSQDGITFRYDGIALRRDPDPCSLEGTGIENVAIVPRTDGAGWRMYYASGSYYCYGWQVFSAVSTDEQRWIREPGIRIPNGGVVPPEDPRTPPWPAGEGMDVTRLPSGEWRMLVGSYEQITPPENRFQITEWRSSDQLHWTYAGPVLTTRQVGPEVRRSVYAPSVQVIAPGLERMYFAGDNMDLVGGASRIYSAVSVDGIDWEVEGVVLSDPSANYFYSTMVDSLLVFIRDVAGRHTLGSVRIETR